MNYPSMSVGALVALLLACASDWSYAAVLPPIPPASGADAFVNLPGTSLAAQPALQGTVQFDQVTPWVFGSFSGSVQTRVVKSTVDGKLTFYYRVTNQSQPQFRVRTFFVNGPGFHGISADVNYRTDGLGTVAPSQAIRKKAGTPVAGEIGFAFARGVLAKQSSRYFFIRTNATRFQTSGAKLDLVVQNGPNGNSGGPAPSQQLSAPQPYVRSWWLPPFLVGGR